LKPLIIIVSLTIVIVVGGCLSLNVLDSESKNLIENLSELEADIEGQNWEAASKKLEAFHSKWDSISNIWSMLIDHYEIDNIELVVSQLTSYVRTKDKNEALSQMSSLRALIKHIPEKESFNLKNIL
jgi:predicted PurR-regulated permease PerM